MHDESVTDKSYGGGVKQGKGVKSNKHALSDGSSGKAFRMVSRDLRALDQQCPLSSYGSHLWQNTTVQALMPLPEETGWHCFCRSSQLRTVCGIIISLTVV